MWLFGRRIEEWRLDDALWRIASQSVLCYEIRDGIFLGRGETYASRREWVSRGDRSR